MKHFSFLFAFLLLRSLLFAQHIKVVDSTSHLPVKNATIYLFDQTAGKIEQGGVTDTSGVITLILNSDNFMVSVTAIGYKKASVKYKGGEQTIYLVPSKTQLKEIQIIADKSPIKFKGNSIAYDISQVPNADYRTLTDIISRLPFLDVDDDKIKMFNEPMDILIDNKTSAIYKDAESLKNLPPQAIDKIEVSLIPTARNQRKTINITLKRDYFLGWNGSVGASGSIYGFSPSASLSYWRKKSGFDLSINERYNSDKSATHTNIFYLQPQQQTSSDERAIQHSNSVQVSLSAYLNLSTSNTIDFQYNISPSNNTIQTNYALATQSGTMFSTDLSSLNSRSQNLPQNFSLNFTHKFQNPDNAFYLLTNIALNKNDREQVLSGQDTSHNLIPTGQYIFNTNNREYTIEAILQHNSVKTFRYTLGTKIIGRNNQGIDIAENSPQDIHMKQWVNTTYADADLTIKKLTAHFGLRSEFNVNSFFTPVSLDEHYFAVIPTLSLNYPINAGNMIILSYTRNLYRPNFSMLSPVVTIASPYQDNKGTENTGNQINNYYSLQYFANLSKIRLGFNIGYSHLLGALRTLSSLDSSGVIQNVTYNVAQNDSYSFGYSVDFSFLKKFRFSHNNNISYTYQRSDNIVNQTWGAYLSDRLTYLINNKSSFDLSLRGHTPNVNFQGLEQSQAYLNFSANYGYYFDWKNKVPVSLNVSLTNPTYLNGLPGYYTTNTNEFTLRSDVQKRNPFIYLGIRIQLKGKKYNNRTFNKEKSIQNNDLGS